MPRYGRVLSRSADALIIHDTAKLTRCPIPPLRVEVGDLVELSPADEILTVTARNTSPRPLESQDWYRLTSVLPNLRARAHITSAVRRWFEREGFLEVHTPLLTRHPTMEPTLSSVEARVGGAARHLMTSPEPHMKRLLSAGVPRLVYLGPAFRDEERGRHHHPEFTILEWYRAAASPTDLMDDVAALVALATGRPRPWQKVTVAEALARWGTPTQDPDDTVRQLVEHVEPAITALPGVFLTDYPAALASLARLSPDDPTVSERFEAYVDGVELANGFGELIDVTEQRARFASEQRQRAAAGLPVHPIDEPFLDALAAGLPPCAGIALGFDRLVMLATGADDLDGVVPFPPEIA